MKTRKGNFFRDGGGKIKFLFDKNGRWILSDPPTKITMPKNIKSLGIDPASPNQ